MSPFFVTLYPRHCYFRVLFDMYSPSTKDRIHQAYAGLLDIPYAERQSIYCQLSAESFAF